MLVFVILVGQGVLGRSADRRPGWPFQDAEECDAPARIGGRRSSWLDRLPMAAMPGEREFDTKALRPGWPFRRPHKPILVWDGASPGSGSLHVRLAMTPS